MTASRCPAAHTPDFGQLGNETRKGDVGPRCLSSFSARLKLKGLPDTSASPVVPPGVQSLSFLPRYKIDAGDAS